MAQPQVLTTISGIDNTFKKIASGKVRDLFEIDPNTLLFVATDRISAFDVVLDNGIPNKGALLTEMSKFWFSFLCTEFTTLRTHFISTNLPSSAPENARAILDQRSMQVHRSKVVPLESIVRGYITGTAWKEYQTSGTVHGMPMPEGLKESQKLDKALWTPSTKAEAGEHDENISQERAAEIVGSEVAKKIEEASLKIYELARDYAEKRGIIIADTKFEFGLDESTQEIVLIDEVLTPDSSRFWPLETYEVGKAQLSYDKQYLRDWLTDAGLKGKPGVKMPDEVVRETARKYMEAYEKLTGSKWDQGI